MLTDASQTRVMEIELRQQAHYWQAQHARATEREAAWKDKARRLEKVVRRQQAQIAELIRELEAAKARIAWLERQVFGRKSEQCPKPDLCPTSGDLCPTSGIGPHDSTPALDDNADASDEPESCNEPRRKRGKQPGAKGYGRKRRHDLPAEEVVHDLPGDQRQCPSCGKPFQGFPGTETSLRIPTRSNGKSSCDVAFTSEAAMSQPAIAKRCQVSSPRPVRRN